MKLFNKSIPLSVSLAALFFAQASFADGTEAGTVVSNTATLSYAIGGVDQSPIDSKDENGNDETTFTVDQKVDLTVTGKNADLKSGVSPSSPKTATANKLTYELSNDGNSVQDFKITVSHLTGDDFDAGTTPATTAPQAAQACEFTVSPSATVNTLADTPTVTLGIDETATIEVTCSMPNRPDVDDGHESIIDVLATAVDSTGAIMKESTIADREDEVDVVLADGTGAASDGADRNAMHSATQTYEIEAPMLTVVKSSKVIEDPFNGTTQPKRIPGAIVEYTITIANTSDSPASGVTIADELTAVTNGEVKFVERSIVNAAGTAEDYDTTTPNTVTATGITVPAGSVATPSEVVVTFQVEIL